MLNITINGRAAQAEAGETILEALNRASVKVPTLCHVEGLAPTGACRLCMVELGRTTSSFRPAPTRRPRAWW